MKNSIPFLTYRYFGSSLCDLVTILRYDTIANVTTQPKNTQAEYCIILPKLCQDFLVNSLSHTKCSLRRKICEPMIPEQLQFFHNVIVLCTTGLFIFSNFQVRTARNYWKLRCQCVFFISSFM